MLTARPKITNSAITVASAVGVHSDGKRIGQPLDIEPSAMSDGSRSHTLRYGEDIGEVGRPGSAPHLQYWFVAAILLRNRAARGGDRIFTVPTQTGQNVWHPL